MTDRRPPYHRRQTKPLPREELAPVAAAADTRPALEETAALARASSDDTPTMCRCPLCCGAGLVPPEIAATFETLVEKAKEQT